MSHTIKTQQIIDVMFTHASPTGYTLAGEIAPKRVIKTEKEKHQQVAEAIEDTAVEELLQEMLQLAIHGGRLPIDTWSDSIAPTLRGIADSVSSSAAHIKTKAEEARGQGGWGLVGGAAQV